MQTHFEKIQKTPKGLKNLLPNPRIVLQVETGMIKPDDYLKSLNKGFLTLLGNQKDCMRFGTEESADIVRVIRFIKEVQDAQIFFE